MIITATQQPLPRSTIPTVVGQANTMYRSSVQTQQESVRKSLTYHGLTDAAALSDVQITTPFSVVLGGFVMRQTDGVYIATVITPTLANPSIANITNLAQSTRYLITIYGR